MEKETLWIYNDYVPANEREVVICDFEETIERAKIADLANRDDGYAYIETGWFATDNVFYQDKIVSRLQALNPQYDVRWLR